MMNTPSLFAAPPLQGQPIPTPTPIPGKAASLFAPQPAPTVPVQADASGEGDGGGADDEPARAPLTVTAPALAAGRTDELSTDDIKRALPSNLRASVTQTMVDTINGISADPVMANNIRENFVGYTAVLRDGKFKTEDYIHAVAYVSFKLMGYNNKDAYARAFPQRYAALLAKSTSDKDISAYVSAYHRGKLVNLIMEQSLVPTWVLNQDMFQRALNVQAELMLGANSEKVRTDAANSILTHLKKPEPKGDFQINLNTPEASGMAEMRAMLGQLATQQRTLIEQGEMKTVDVAASRLVQIDGNTDV